MNKWHMPIICHYLAARYSSRNQHQIASCQTCFQLFRGRHFGVSRIAHDLAGLVKWCWMNWRYSNGGMCRKPSHWFFCFLDHLQGGSWRFSLSSILYQTGSLRKCQAVRLMQEAPCFPSAGTSVNTGPGWPCTSCSVSTSWLTCSLPVR